MRLRSHTVGVVSFWHEGVRHNRALCQPRVVAHCEWRAFHLRGAVGWRCCEHGHGSGGENWVRDWGLQGWLRYIIMWRRGFLREK